MDLYDMRQKLAGGDLQHKDIEELVTLAEQQETMIQALEKKANLAQTWARAHYNGKRKAEAVLLDSVKRVARESAALARRWPKHELASVVHGQPTKEQANLARAVANGIATHILNQVQGE